MTALSGRQRALVSWGLRKLDGISTDSLPSSKESLKILLNPRNNKVVGICDQPSTLLDVLTKVSDVPGNALRVKLQCQSNTKENLTWAEVSTRIMKTCKNKSQKWNCRVVFCMPCSDIGTEITANFVRWVDEQRCNFSAMKKAEALDKIGQEYYKQCMKIEQSNKTARRVMANMFETKFIELSRKNLDCAIKYNFPSSFSILCFEYLLEQTEAGLVKEFDSMNTGRGNTDIFKQAISETNKMLEYLKQKLVDPKSCEEMERESRIMSSAGVLGKRKRSRWSSPPQRHLKRIRRRTSGSEDSASSSMESGADELLNKLCTTVEKLTVNDIALIPEKISYECVLAISRISKMGDDRPKTKKALLNVLETSCRFVYIVPFRHFDLSEKGTSPKHEPIELKQRPTTHIISFEPKNFLEVSTEPTTGFRKEGTQLARIDQMLKPKVSNFEFGYSGIYRTENENPALDESESMVKFMEMCRTYADNLAKENSTFILPADELTKLQMTAQIYQFLSRYKSSGLLTVRPDEVGDLMQNELMKVLVHLHDLSEEACIESLHSCHVVSLTSQNTIAIAKEKVHPLLKKYDKDILGPQKNIASKEKFKRYGRGRSKRGRYV